MKARGAGRIRRYLHLGTGNYNRLYGAPVYLTLDLFTANDEIGTDVSDLFNSLTGYSHKTDFRRLLIAPKTMRAGLASLIERETALGSRGHLIFKANALEDKEIIQLLYQGFAGGRQEQLI